MKKRRPITETKTKIFKSRLYGSNLISDFHVRLKRGGTLDGLEEYQLASIKGAKKAKKEIVGQWVIPYLSPSKGCPGCGFSQGEVRKKIRLLDVGALNGQAYAKFRHIQTCSIDLHPMDPSVKKQDFFERPAPKECQMESGNHIPGDLEDYFDVISLSLVINFVPDASQRGISFPY
jgi:25S rRNA (adenine2142-N1)-methyltransferase